jgi:hypothetical protein
VPPNAAPIPMKSAPSTARRAVVLRVFLIIASPRVGPLGAVCSA